MSCGVGHRRGSDPVLLWLWPAATAPIGPLAWETPYTEGAALKRKKKKVLFASSSSTKLNSSHYEGFKSETSVVLIYISLMANDI